MEGNITDMVNHKLEKTFWSGVPGDAEQLELPFNEPQHVKITTLEYRPPEYEVGVYNNPKYQEANQAFKDPIVEKVLQRVKARSEQGMKTYGVPMTRSDINTIQWLRHAQEEALDLAVYLERTIDDLENNRHSTKTYTNPSMP